MCLLSTGSQVQSLQGVTALAQSEEHLAFNQVVVGSSPTGGVSTCLFAVFQTLGIIIVCKGDAGDMIATAIIR
jgi:hypothetical protein